MDRGWTNSDSRSNASARALERAVFERVFGYRAVPGVKVPRFTEDRDMTEAVIRHIDAAWEPRSFQVWSRPKADREWMTEAVIAVGFSVFCGSGPTKGIAVCRAATRLAAKRAPQWVLPDPPDLSALFPRIGW
jgi:hypothetical protein